jgi:hypothetical protein
MHRITYPNDRVSRLLNDIDMPCQMSFDLWRSHSDKCER